MVDNYSAVEPGPDSNLANTDARPPSNPPHRTCKVVFQPSGRSGLVPEGTTLLEAARQLGVGIEAICGGHETCNKCLVQIEEGEFPKHNLHSRASHLTPMTERERRYHQEKHISVDSRFSCSARVVGDILVTVPE